MKREFTKNEAVAMMHENLSFGLRLIADHIEKHKMDWKEIVDLLREIIDEQEAQSIVVRLREELQKI